MNGYAPNPANWKREPHTPAPWFVSGDGACETLVRAGDRNTGMRIATTFASHASQATADTRLKRIRENEANARLIAAAPDLLKALTELLGNAEHARMYMQHENEEAQIMASALYDTILQAREALQKVNNDSH